MIDDMLTPGYVGFQGDVSSTGQMTPLRPTRRQNHGMNTERPIVFFGS